MFSKPLLCELLIDAGPTQAQEPRGWAGGRAAACRAKGQEEDVEWVGGQGLGVSAQGETRKDAPRPIGYHSAGVPPQPPRRADPFCRLSAGRISEARFGFSALSPVSRREAASL